MGLIKTVVTPIATLAMKMSFPSDNSNSAEDVMKQVEEQNKKELKFQELDTKKKQSDAWCSEHPYPDYKEEDNPYLLTPEEDSFLQQYKAEKLKAEDATAEDSPEGSSGDSSVENKVSKNFGKKFGELYEKAIMNFIGNCIVKPIGGPASVTKTLSIKADLQKCGEAAYKETFLGESDPENTAKTFGDEFANGCYAEHENQVKLWAVIPATPPVMPVTPGGPIIAVPSASVVPVMFKALKSALEKTFPQPGSQSSGTSPDPHKIADKFASKLSTAGIIMGTYALTCKCPPGGGKIIVS